MTESRVIFWPGSTNEVFQLDPERLAPIFGIPEGMHIRILTISFETGSSGSFIVLRDNRGVLRKVTTFARVQLPALVTLDTTVRRSYGMTHKSLTATTGGTGFNETITLAFDWEIMKTLILARDSTSDVWTLIVDFEYVKGEMAWDPLSETDKIRQLKDIEVSPGGIWHQPGTDPGDPYDQVDLSGNI